MKEVKKKSKRRKCHHTVFDSLVELKENIQSYDYENYLYHNASASLKYSCSRAYAADILFSGFISNKLSSKFTAEFGMLGISF